MPKGASHLPRVFSNCSGYEYLLAKLIRLGETSKGVILAAKISEVDECICFGSTAEKE